MLMVPGWTPALLSYNKPATVTIVTLHYTHSHYTRYTLYIKNTGSSMSNVRGDGDTGYSRYTGGAGARTSCRRATAASNLSTLRSRLRRRVLCRAGSGTSMGYVPPNTRGR